MRFLPRILTLACLAVCLTTVAAWPMSYRWGGMANWRGYGIGLTRGGYYFAGPATFGGEDPLAVERTDNGYTVEGNAGRPTQRWKPFKLLDGVGLGTMFVIAAWVPPLAMAVPSYLGIRRWRRQARDATRGFEVNAATRV